METTDWTVERDGRTMRVELDAWNAPHYFSVTLWRSGPDVRRPVGQRRTFGDMESARAWADATAEAYVSGAEE